MWRYCMLFETLRKTLSKKRPWHRCFPVNFVKFLRTPCIREHTWWLLLTVKNYSKSKSKNQSKTLRKKCPYSKLFWSAFFPAFSRTRTEYGYHSNRKSIQQNFYFGSVIFDIFFFFFLILVINVNDINVLKFSSELSIFQLTRDS